MTAKPDPFRSLGFAAVDWIEHYLVHGPGDVQGQPIELDDEFAAFIVKCYSLDAKGQRRVRRAFLSRAKGRSKSGLAAMIECFEALGPCRFDHWAEAGEVSPWGYEYELGEPVGKALVYVECLNVATEEGQAGNTYDAVYYMLDPETAAPELVRDYGRIDVGLARTTLPNRRGFIEPVTAKDTSNDGGKSTFIVADETHLWILPRLKRLHGVMTRNLMKRKVASGWMLETSTMYGEGEGSVAEGTHAYAKSVENGRRKDSALLFDHVQASEKWDLSKRSERVKALRQAYGPAAAWMDLGAIADSWDDPQVSEAEWRRYWLNQPVPMLAPPESALDLTGWAETETTDAAQDIIAFGVAVSMDRAWSAIGAAGVREDGSPWIEVVKHDRGVHWVPARCIELDAKYTATFVLDGNGPANRLIEELQAAGLTVIVANTKDVGQACAWLVDKVAERTVWHGPQPVLDAAVAGARRRNIGDGMFAFGRRASSVDISPLEAVTLAGHLLQSVVPLDDVSVFFV